MLNNKFKHFPVLLALVFSSQAFATTIADDFTQAVVNDFSVAISSLSWSGGILTVTTSSNHGYAVGNTVTISGSVTDSNSVPLNGSYVIIAVTSNTFTVSLASNPGTFSNVSSGTTLVGNGLQWQPLGDACLTAGTAANNSTTLGSVHYSSIPGCNVNGTVPSADAAGSGALRLTPGQQSTGSQSAGSQTGAIVSGTTFPSNQGLQVTFTTYTYGGDTGGTAGQGADGIGFFLQDGSVGTTVGRIGPVTTAGALSNIGAFGGSLGYSCSQSKGAGLTGAYLGLGMDEYGNFLNSGDNTATGIPNSNWAGGGGVTTNGTNTWASNNYYQPNRIGLRGAGSVSSSGLNQYNSYYYPATSSTPVTTALIESTCLNGTVSGSGNTINSAAWSGGVLTVTTNSTHHYLAGNTVTIGALSGSYVIATVPTGTTFTVAMATNPGAVAGNTTLTVMDYPVIPGGYYVLPNAQKISDTAAATRANAWPITYRLIITPGGLLSFMYAYNGGAYSSVLTNFPITTSNGPLPSTFRFGFTGSTGGSNNVHEISCFVAEPVQSTSSIGANTIQSGQVRTGTQVYLASYNPNGWMGALVSDPIVNTSGTLSVSTVSDWDANCVLTGGACPNTGVAIATAEAPTYSTTSRQLLTWNGSAGVPLEWANLTAAQQTVLSPDSTTNGQYRLNWLRGDRTEEQTVAGPLRTRGGVLGDIVDSSPLWVGSPSATYVSPFTDSLYANATPAPTIPENGTGAQAYSAYTSSMATRMNVVYAGSNDGLLHGFRSGHNNSDGTYNEQAGNPDGIANDGLNDGHEVIGFMPSTVLSDSNVVGLTSPTYGHNYFVDAPPGTGDLFYNGAWHTWLVGGIGPGGAEIYALDVTDPTGLVASTSAFKETNAANLVMGDWTSSSLTAMTCVNAVANCGNNLVDTYGTPLIRRLHNGQWAIIFGNGLAVSIAGMAWSGNVLTVTTSSRHGYAANSTVVISGGITDSNSVALNGSYTITAVTPTTFTVALASNPGTFSNVSSGVTALTSNNNHAGVFIGLINSSTGTVSSFYWLDTGTGSSTSPDGIAYVSSADLDGDHVTDYLYAGDLLGNVWRFDLTSSNPADWGASTFGHASATPLFIAKNSGGTVQPITTKIAVTGTTTGGKLRVMLGFGTGQATPFTTASGVTYASGQQTVYGIWDWDMTQWNCGTAYTQKSGTAITGTTCAGSSVASPTTANGVTIPASAAQFSALAEARSTGPTVYQTTLLTRANLLQNTATETAATATFPATRTLPISNVSWCGSSTCSSPNNQYGWYFDLPDTVSYTTAAGSPCGATTCYEQIIYSPIFSGGELLVNSTIPATTTVAQCTPSLPTGWTMAFSMASGGGLFQNVFPDSAGSLTVTTGHNSIVGLKQGSVGTPYVVSVGSKQYAVNPNAGGGVNMNQLNTQGGVTIKRISWGELR